ncbi:iron-hydroxamate ABC transporter substrate-binding protein [Paenibacillus sp. Marseille-P2973]|uniref:iron-hydroxamate ABC transporter substrate-binding protein n=1 Tax=Paenibacillus sp. Marseille-P2973 TaxID=1871032 RepID=UPI001B366C5E|nr:iron-hydroxamate ABC transporter substrate-binding protein [Paenibacillus sp. Marseille-P2973]MBQ4902052.1 iron-hydroxamate ABC transporter substrate-binding protein [Paenibacillus sp. Marseille-P2973]
MKKLLLPLLVLTVFALSACGNNTSNNSGANSSTSDVSTNSANSSADTITYQSENGPIEVPAHPQRVVVLSGYAGNLLALGVPLAGADSWTKNNPNFQDRLKDVPEVSEENVESILNAKPDLIIAGSDIKNADKLKQIAPLVTYTYNNVDYLTQVLEIGKAVNQEQKAADWIADFKERAQKAGEEIKAKIGADSTISIIEGDSKALYTFGDAWGRGTEIIYQAMGLKMPDKVKEMTAKEGYYDLSLEVLPDYMGDYVIYSKEPASDASFQQTDTYKNIPAVKNGRVFEVDATGFYFNDADSLDYQLDFITKSLLGSK